MTTRPTRYLTLEVTQEDIDGARADRVTEYLSESCPLARCLTRATGQKMVVVPLVEDRTTYAAEDRTTYAGTWPKDHYDEISQAARLPPECLDFMRAHDRMKPAKPMTFKARLPEEWFCL